MAKIILDKEDENLNHLLDEAYEMLTAIGIQPAAKDTVVIRYDKNKYKRYTATCTKANGKYYITLHYRAKEEQPVNGRPLHTFRAIMHELVHTCTNTKTGEWLTGHNEQFRNYAKMVQDTYGINIIATIKVGDFKNTHLPCVYRITCSKCGSAIEYYSEKEWKKDKEYYEKYGMLCGYCGHTEKIA